MKAAKARHAAAAAMTEAELDNGVRQIIASIRARGRPLLAYHTWNSKHSAKGFPDWCMAGPGGVMWRELKIAGEEPDEDQQEWLDALTAAGMNAGTWYPADLLDGTVARELAALAGMRGGH